MDSLRKSLSRFLQIGFLAILLAGGCGGEAKNPHLASVELEQLIVRPVPSQSTLDKVRREAEEVLRQLQEGADFGELARRYSTHRQSAERGGEVTVASGWMDPAFDTAVQAMKDSTLSGVIETPEAFYIVCRLSGIYLQMRASHILVAVDRKLEGEALERDFERARREAWDLYHRLQNGESFFELARAHSGDPGTAEKGGDVGWQKRGQLAKEFEDVAYSQEPGQISKPVRTSFGWHIVRTVQKKDLSLNLKMIEFKPKVDEAERRMAKKALEEARRQAAAGQSLEAVAQSLAGNPDGKFSYHEKYSVRKNVLRPELAAELAKLDEGDLSPVLENESGFYFVRLVARDE
ncbi:MAG: peptidylprolyl isomerase [Candidatus Glassbacteria bacterium]